MTKEKIKEIVIGFLVEELEIEENKITDEALLKDDLGIESLDFVDIVVIVERNFGFKIKPEEMSEIKTVSQFLDYIESKACTQSPT
jgi:acyl carrier protein